MGAEGGYLLKNGLGEVMVWVEERNIILILYTREKFFVWEGFCVADC